MTTAVANPPPSLDGARGEERAGRWLGADIIIGNAPDPVFV